MVGQITKHNKVIVKVKIKMNGFLWEMGKLLMFNVMVNANFKVKVKLESLSMFQFLF